MFVMVYVFSNSNKFAKVLFLFTARIDFNPIREHDAVVQISQEAIEKP